MSLNVFYLRYQFSQIQKLVIIRHGQSQWNKQKKWAGWSDIRLSQTGIKEAKQCGKMLKNTGILFDLAFSSVLTRSIQTLNYILDQMDLHYIPVYKTWRLNEKHYGSLTGQSKLEITKQYGEQKVAEWRRSFDISPPPVDINDERHPSKDRRYAEIDSKELPLSQNQNDLVKRIESLWNNQIKRNLIDGKNILISAHGGSARSLVKIISNLPNKEIMQFNLPNAIPLVYTFEVDDNKNLILKNMEFIGDPEQITAKMKKSIPMNKIFEPFQYQLNLNTDSEKSPGKIKRQNSTKTISVLITPYTDVFLQAKNICLSNNLSQNLVLILAASISEQIQKQALSSQKNDSYSSISSNLSQQSKKKSFKNRFCQSLQESKCSNADNQSTFINNDLTTNKSILNNSDQEQYSFRPVTYLKMLDMTDDDQENQSISINDFSVNQSYLTNDSKKSKQIGKIVMKNIFSKKSTNVFDNLYQHSKILSCKKEIQLKKSIQKNIFKPQINQMSKKILQNKQQAILQTKNNFTLKSTEKFKSRNQSPQFFTRSKSKSNLYANITEKNNSFRLQSQKQNQLSIYERGMIYRKKSQQKLFKMKERQIIDQIKSCTFKPKLNQRDKSQKSKLLSVSYRKII